MLKTRVEIVTGFIGAGKTTWINVLVKETLVQEEKIVILQLEMGQEKINLPRKNREDLTIITREEEQLTGKYLNNILILYSPDRLIIECNGMQSLEELVMLFEEDKIKEKAFIATCFNLIEAPGFKVYYQNLKPILAPGLKRGDMIIVTRNHLISSKEKEELKQLIESENLHGHLLITDDLSHMQATAEASSLLDKGWAKVLRIKLRRQLKK